MINRNNILLITHTSLPHIRINKNTTAERIATPMILPLIPPFFEYARSTKNGDHSSTLADIHALLRRLVRPHDMGQLVLVQKGRDGLVAKTDRARPSLTLAKAAVVQPAFLLTRRRVRPQQVIRQLFDLNVTAVRLPYHDGFAVAFLCTHLCGAGDTADALQSGCVWCEWPWDSAVHAEDDVIDGGCEGQVVEDGVGQSPDVHAHVGAVLLLHLAEEASIAVVGLPAVR